MTAPFAAGGNVEQAQKAAATGVQGYGASLQPQMLRQIGTTLGGLNSIGGLRSGAVPVALNDAAQQYGSAVGNYAKMASGEAIGAGLSANEQDLLKQQLDQQRKSSLLGAIGNVLGTGLGFASNFLPGGGLAKKAVSTALGPRSTN
jgi:hypothetical protein